MGLRASQALAISDAVTLTARGMLGWNHAFGDVTPQSRLALAGGQSFAISGLPIAREAARIEAGVDFGITKSTTIAVSYTGQLASQVYDNAVKADLTIRF
ncbi:autotransporter domain-containing protein [Bradyrhizobium genosp. P]|uniref:autotransporter domain-containing protein n=1 Tax=Bradyrhizobium genosp. P TaxID=83641 RepID=UPI003CE9C42C